MRQQTVSDECVSGLGFDLRELMAVLAVVVQPMEGRVKALRVLV